MTHHHFDIVKPLNGQQVGASTATIDALIHALYEKDLWFDRSGCSPQWKDGATTYILRSNLATVIIKDYDRCPDYRQGAKQTGVHVTVDAAAECTADKVRRALHDVYLGEDTSVVSRTRTLTKNNGGGKQ